MLRHLLLGIAPVGAVCSCVGDLACSVCGDGPILVGQFAGLAEEGDLAKPVGVAGHSRWRSSVL